MCYTVCGVAHVKEPLLLIGFPLSPTEWYFTIYNNRKQNVLNASLNITFPSFRAYSEFPLTLKQIVSMTIVITVNKHSPKQHMFVVHSKPTLIPFLSFCNSLQSRKVPSVLLNPPPLRNLCIMLLSVVKIRNMG